MTDIIPEVQQEQKVDVVEDDTVAPASIDAPTQDMCEPSTAERCSDQGEAMDAQATDAPISAPAVDTETPVVPVPGQAVDAPTSSPAVDTVTPVVPVPGEPITARSPVPPANGGVCLSGIPMLSTTMPSLTSYNSKIGTFKPITCNVKGIGLPASCTPVVTVPPPQSAPQQPMVRRPILANNLAAPPTLSFQTPVLKTTAASVSSTISGPMIPQSGSIAASQVSRPPMSTPVSRGSGGDAKETNANSQLSNYVGKEGINSKFNKYIDNIQATLMEHQNAFFEIFQKDDSEEIISKFQVTIGALNEKLNNIVTEMKEEASKGEANTETDVEPVQEKTGDEGSYSNSGSASIQPRLSQTSQIGSVDKNSQ